MSAVTASRDRLARHGSIHGAKRSNVLVGETHTIAHMRDERSTMRVEVTAADGVNTRAHLHHPRFLPVREISTAVVLARTAAPQETSDGSASLLGLP
jgi:hypothetical protein